MFLGKESLSTVSCGICTHTLFIKPDPLLGKKTCPIDEEGMGGRGAQG